MNVWTISQPTTTASTSVVVRNGKGWLQNRDIVRIRVDGLKMKSVGMHRSGDYTRLPDDSTRRARNGLSRAKVFWSAVANRASNKSRACSRETAVVSVGWGIGMRSATPTPNATANFSTKSIPGPPRHFLASTRRSPLPSPARPGPPGSSRARRVAPSGAGRTARPSHRAQFLLSACCP